MKNAIQSLVSVISIMLASTYTLSAEPIYYEAFYPKAKQRLPAVILLHTSSGFKSIRRQIPKYRNAGYVVYAPDFFRRHKLSYGNRFETWTTYRRSIEAELTELVQVVKKDRRVDSRNIFAVGFSNGGYWASFLAAKRFINASASHYGVWSWPQRHGFVGFPANYFSLRSNPVLALHGDADSIQRSKFVFHQLERAKKRSPRFRTYIFKNVGHSWDCIPCTRDGFDHMVTRKSLSRTLRFFKNNTIR